MNEVIYDIISNSEDETRGIVGRARKLFLPGTVVALNGNLGSGKTLFVKEAAKLFGITDVDSPTFTIVNEYFGEVKVNHIDFYRIKKFEELIDIGIYDYINETEAVNFIEWADMFPEALPEDRLEIVFEILGEGKRRITIGRAN